jgi:hypothetical protein
MKEPDKSWFIARRSPVFSWIMTEMVYLLVRFKGTLLEVYMRMAEMAEIHPIVTHECCLGTSSFVGENR